MKRRNARVKTFYRKILLMCLAVLLLLTFLQTALYFRFSTIQFQGYSSELTEKVVGDIGLNIDNYFDSLDKQLDAIYKYQSFLANLNDLSKERYELPARSLLAQTRYFQAMQGIYVYNNSNVLKSGYRRTKELSDLDIFATQDPAEDALLDFLKDGQRRTQVLCCQDADGNEFVRMVKRVYQNMGYTQVGYIVCDMRPTDIAQIVSNGACAQDQYIWILSENGQGCYLSQEKSENAWNYMRTHLSAGAQGAYETLERGNHYYQTEPSPFGIVLCAFTDETRTQKNYRMILTTLLQGDLAAMILFAVAGMIMSRRVNLRIGGVTDTLSRIAGGNTQLRLPVGFNDEIGVICDNFNQMMDQLEQRTHEEEQARRALDDARYHALQAQINPHFLYNTMETIGAIATAQGCTVVDDMCSAFSKMLRYSIQTDSEGKAVTLREELTYVQDYMFIIGVRMMNEIQLRMDIEEDVWNVRLPRLSIPRAVPFHSLPGSSTHTVSFLLSRRVSYSALSADRSVVSRKIL